MREKARLLEVEVSATKVELQENMSKVVPPVVPSVDLDAETAQSDPDIQQLMASPAFGKYKQLLQKQMQADAAKSTPPPPATAQQPTGVGGENVPTPTDSEMDELDEEGVEKLILAARSEGPDHKRAFGEMVKTLGLMAKKQKCG